MQMQPIMKYKDMLALKAHRMSETYHNRGSLEPALSAQQSASTIHMNYGRSLRPEIVVCDSLYALKEIYEFVSQAELQFLQLCDMKLYDFQESQYLHNRDCLPDLKNLKQLLYRHLHENKQALASIEKVYQSQWPRSENPEMSARVEAATQALHKDFMTLVEMSDNLYKHCTEAIGVLMNELVIMESKGARLQALRLGKLTFLAFIFVPLSFTTSFFGMNFKELGADGRALSIWVWFLLSVPLLTLAIFLFVYDLSRIWIMVQDWVSIVIRCACNISRK